VTQLATSERRKLDAEVEETGEQVAAREAKSAREEQLKAEVKNVQAAFYCSVYRKQYKTVSEMENHLRRMAIGRIPRRGCLVLNVSPTPRYLAESWLSWGHSGVMCVCKVLCCNVEHALF
jgi:hypothetical protein